MKNLDKIVAILASGAMTFGLMACGDDVTNEEIIQNSTTSLGTIETKDDLPDCSEDIVGQTAFVVKENAFYGCNGESWLKLSSSTVSMGDNVCTSKALDDDMGFTIICNGDSIGVVRNGLKGDPGKPGQNGDPGKDGNGCTIASNTDSIPSDFKINIACGSETFTMDLSGLSPITEDEECESGSEECIPLDSVKVGGVSQKGPFTKGASVTAYELLNGKSLKQTGNNFNGTIQNDDGSFDINTVKLASQYAYLVAEGYYRNEVSGRTSAAPIKLRALTNLRGRSKANINLVTHLEYDRVNNLVTKNGQKVPEAKKQAEKSIFAAFGIDSENFEGYAEDYNILEPGDGNAALLAISALLQGNHTEAELTALLASLSIDLGDNGLWDNYREKAEIADWAMEKDLSTKGLEEIRKNVEGWGLSNGAKAPDFEKHIRKFWYNEYQLGDCDADNAGAIRSSKSKHSRYYAEKDSAFTEGDSVLTRFICTANGDTYAWRYATNIEKDTYFFEKPTSIKALLGRFNTEIAYVYENGKWRNGTAEDVDEKLGPCVADSIDVIHQSSAGSDTSWYKCVIAENVSSDGKAVPTAWRKATVFEADSYKWDVPTEDASRTGNVYPENIYVYDVSNAQWRRGNSLDIDAALGPCTKRVVESQWPVAASSTGKWYLCSSDVESYVEGKLLPSAWRIATDIEKNTIGFKCDHVSEMKTGYVDTDAYFYCENKVQNSWRRSTVDERDTVGFGAPSTDAARTGVVNKNYVYVYDFELKQWRRGSDLDLDEKLGPCTSTMMKKQWPTAKASNDKWYICSDDANISIGGNTLPMAWRLATPLEVDTYGNTCEFQSQMKLGRVQTTTYYYCSDKAQNIWREATIAERDTVGFGTPAANKASLGVVNSENVYVYDATTKKWRRGTNLDSDAKLGPCVTGTVANVKAASNGTYYICSMEANVAIDGTTLPMAWIAATSIEKDTYGFTCIYNSQMKLGNVNTTTYYYCSDKTTNTWREATVAERDTVGFGTPSVNKYSYGKVYTSNVYVFDNRTKKWRRGTTKDADSKLGPCVTDSLGKMRQAYSDSKWYICANDANVSIDGATLPMAWRLPKDDLEMNTYGFTCSTYGEAKKGYVSTDRFYYCIDKAANLWRRATDEENDVQDSAKTDGHYIVGAKTGKSFVYDITDDAWRLASASEITVKFGCTKKLATSGYTADNATYTYPKGTMKSFSGSYKLCKTEKLWETPSAARNAMRTNGCYKAYPRRYYSVGGNGYVCEADTFAVATASEKWAYSNIPGSDARCRKEDYGTTVTLSQAKTTYICNANQLYEWDQTPILHANALFDGQNGGFSSGIAYHVTTIGTQFWITTNLAEGTTAESEGRYTFYLTGASIYNGPDFKINDAAMGFAFTRAGGTLSCGRMGYNDQSNTLYTGLTFRLPTETEWDILFATIKNSDLSLRGTTDWDDRLNGHDEYYFSMYPTGAPRTEISLANGYYASGSDGTKKASIGSVFYETRFMTSSGNLIKYAGGKFSKETYNSNLIGSVRCIAGTVSAPPTKN